jgi:hypothetical protein
MTDYLKIYATHLAIVTGIVLVVLGWIRFGIFIWDNTFGWYTIFAVSVVIIAPVVCLGTAAGQYGDDMNAKKKS